MGSQKNESKDSLGDQFDVLAEEFKKDQIQMKELEKDSLDEKEQDHQEDDDLTSNAHSKQDLAKSQFDCFVGEMQVVADSSPISPEDIHS